MIDIDLVLQYIIRLRKSSKKTASEISHEMGFNSQNGYVKIENGKTDLKISHINTLATIFEISPIKILAHGTKKAVDFEEVVNNHSEKIKDLQFQIDKLTDNYAKIKKKS